MINPLAESPKSPDLEEVINYLEHMDYSQRRKWLWHKTKPRLSRFLYKFRSMVASDTKSVDRMRDLIVRSRFWLSSPVDFNDPYDMSANFSVEGSIAQRKKRIEELLIVQGRNWNQRQKERPAILSKSDAELREVVRATFQKTIERTGIYSFGGDPRSILMWSHYADNHKGFCLQFEVARDPKTLIFKVATMKYCDDYPVLNWITEIPDRLEIVISRKHTGWRYEGEKRLVVLEGSHQYVPFRPEALQGIIIGCRADDGEVSRLRELLAERSALGYPLPTVYRAFKHNTKYRLVIRKET